VKSASERRSRKSLMIIVAFTVRNSFFGEKVMFFSEATLGRKSFESGMLDGYQRAEEKDGLFMTVFMHKNAWIANATIGVTKNRIFCIETDVGGVTLQKHSSIHKQSLRFTAL
jgi:hypothetical protein